MRWSDGIGRRWARAAEAPERTRQADMKAGRGPEGWMVAGYIGSFAGPVLLLLLGRVSVLPAETLWRIGGALLLLWNLALLGWAMRLAARDRDRLPTTPLRSPAERIGSMIVIVGTCLLAVTLLRILTDPRTQGTWIPAAAESSVAIAAMWYLAGGYALKKTASGWLPWPHPALALMLFSGSAFYIAVGVLTRRGPGGYVGVELARLAPRSPAALEAVGLISLHGLLGAAALVLAIRGFAAYRNDILTRPVPAGVTLEDARRRRNLHLYFTWYSVAMLVFSVLGALVAGQSLKGSGPYQLGSVIQLVPVLLLSIGTPFLDPLWGRHLAYRKSAMREGRPVHWDEWLGYAPVAGGLVMMAGGLVRIVSVAATGDGWAAIAASTLAICGYWTVIAGGMVAAMRWELRRPPEPRSRARRRGAQEGLVVGLCAACVGLLVFWYLLLQGAPQMILPWQVRTTSVLADDVGSALKFLVPLRILLFGLLIMLPFHILGWVIRRRREAASGGEP